MSADGTARPGSARASRDVRRSVLVVLLVTALVVGAVLAYSLLATPEYTARARVLVGPPPGSVVGQSGVVVSSEEVATQEIVAASRAVAELVAEEMGDSGPGAALAGVTVEQLGESRVLEASVVAADADEAASRADAVAGSYVDYSRTLAQRSSQQAYAEASQRRAQILDRLVAIEDELAGSPSTAEESLLVGEQRELQTELGSLTAALDARAAAADTSARVLTVASVPRSPSSPRLVLNLGLGVAVGLLLGAVVAVVLRRSTEPRVD